MSLIHTCELNDVDPLDYLTELQRHAEELAVNPAGWMPWNHRAALETSLSRPDADCAALPKAHNGLKRRDVRLSQSPLRSRFHKSLPQ